MQEAGYRRILESLEEGRRALARARVTAGLVRFLGIGLASLAALVLWALLMRGLRLYSVPLASAASILGAGLAVFALVRWLVIPLVRLPNRDDFVRMVERRYPQEKNLLVNAYQLGDPRASGQGAAAPDLVDILVQRASERVRGLDLRKWRDPAPDRPFLWAGGAALGAMLLLAVLSPSLLKGALGQVIRPSLAEPPPVHLTLLPGDVEVDRGSDVVVTAEVEGTDHRPVLEFRERNGTWRERDFLPEDVTRDGGAWRAMLPGVDRRLEYRAVVRRTESPVFTIGVREAPRLAGFRAHLDYPDYTGLSTETLTSGTGELAAVRGTQVDLRVLTNRPLAAGRLEWRADDTDTVTVIPLTALDETTWKADLTLMDPASYAVVLVDESGAERLRSPRYRVDPVPDRIPLLTLHFPQDDHDLAEDMMERVVADAADDYGFSAVRIRYRVDDGDEESLRFTPFTPGQKEFRFDTVWDLSGLDLLPGSVVSYYVEVRDNDTVSGPKAVRSPVRRVRFPTMAELYEEVADDHDREIGTLSEMQDAQDDLRRQLENLSEDLKRGEEFDWEKQKDVERAMERQTQLESQLSEVVDRLRETLDKAANRAQMNQDLVQKMAELNKILDEVADEEMKRAFQELSRALERMDKNAIREALENFQMSQEQMLKGMDRTIELLKQIRRDEQMADVVQRTEEIARLQEEIAKELEKLGMKPPPEDGTQARNPEDTANLDRADSENPENPENLENQPPTDEESGEKAGQSDAAEGKETSSEEKTGDESQTEEGKQSEGEQKDGQQQEGDKQEQGDQDKQGESSDPSQQQDDPNRQPQGEKESEKEGEQSSDPGQSEQGKSLSQLAQQQQQAEQLVEELKRMLQTLKKLNEEEAPDMAEALDQLENESTLSELQKSMKSSEQNMNQGKPKETSVFAFKARDEANQLAAEAQKMQQQMAQEQEDDTIDKLEKVIVALIDISGVEEQLVQAPGTDSRLLAQRQNNLSENARSVTDSLEAVMLQSFTLSPKHVEQLDRAVGRMERSTSLFDQGNREKAEFEGREAASDLNQTIVQLMKSHQQMCQGGGSGNPMKSMQGLSESQDGLNQSTKELLEKLAGKKRLSYSEEQRMAQLAAQQEMIRQGLEELTQELGDAQDLLGDMQQVQEEMEQVEQDLSQKRVDPRIKERQQQILSRLLDAQRSIRQREMSPQRQSRAATLAQRQSPPPLSEDLLRRNRTLEEDVLRGADDRYPSQYRKLVEEYFRALSREDRSP